MPTFYVDPVNGLDSNNGTTWALARKSLTAAGWQSFPGLTGDSIVNVAKTPDPVAIGSATFTSGSKNVDFNDVSVTTLFDKWGGPGAIPSGFTATRNTWLPGNYPNTSGGFADDFKLTGSAEAGTLALSLGPRSHSSGQNYYYLVGALKFSSAAITLPTNKTHYIAVRFSSRAAATKIALTTRATYTSDIRDFISANANTDDLTAKRARFVYVQDQNYTGGAGDTIPSRTANIGGALFSATETERIGTTDIAFFPVSAADLLGGIGFLINSAANSTTIIDGVYLVTNLADKLPPEAQPVNVNVQNRTVGLNFVIGATAGQYQQMQQIHSLIVRETSSSATERAPSKFSGVMTFNWNTATATLPARAAITTQINYDVFLSAGASGFLNFQVRGGVNPATDVQDGITRLSNVFATATSTAPGANNFELYLRNGTFSGFSTYNFAQGLRLKLNSTRVNQNYTFEDIQGNNYGYYLYSDDATCPSKVYIHYKNFGPNNALLTDTTLSACTGWSANLTKAFTSFSTSNVGWSMVIEGAPPAPPIMHSWGVDVVSSASVSPKYIRPRAWSNVSVTSNVTLPNTRRNRGVKYVASSTVNVNESLRRATKRSWAVNNTSSMSMKFGKVISPQFTSISYTGVVAVNDVAKGFAWNVPATTAAVFTLPTNIPMNWSVGAATSESFTTARTRGYKWSSPMTVTFTEGIGTARTIRYTSATNVAVNESLSKKVVRGFSSSTTSNVTETIPVARGISTLIQTVSSGAVNLLRAMKLGKFTSSNTTNVSETLMRARTISMPVVATSTVTTLTRRGKTIQFALSAASSVSNKLRRAIPAQWVSSNAVQIYFDQNKMFRWTVGVASNVVNSIRRNRGVKWTAQEIANASWNLNANRKNSMANVSATTSSNMALDRVRGMFFTVPVNSYTTLDIDLKSRTNSVITAHPVVSITLIRTNNRSFEVTGQTGSEMTVRLNKGMYYTVGQYVTIDGELLKDTHVAQDEFGAISASNFAFGIGRGVRHETAAEVQVSVGMVRSITLGWGVVTNSNMGVSSNPNRLDAFYVDYEEPVTSSLKDGSIVMGQRKTYSSGILHDVRPVFDVTIHPAPTYTITLYEEVFA